MSILARYVLREYFRIFILTALTLLSLFIIISLFEILSDALDYKAELKSVLKYLFFKVPQAFYFMAPLVLLISTILSMGILSKSLEITSMMASGIALTRITLPIFIVGIILWGLTFLNGEYFLPFATREMERIRKEEIKKEPPRRVGYRKDNLWYRSDNGTIWDIGLIGEEGKALRKIRLFELKDNEWIKQTTDCVKAEWVKDQWTFMDCWIRTFEKNGLFDVEHFEKKDLHVPETPPDFIAVKKEPSKMSFMEIREYIQHIKREGLDSTKYEVDMHGKLSFPYICFIMCLIGVPFSLKTGRQGGVARGIGVGVVTGFSVWFIYSMGLALGHSGKIPVLAAAWGSNIMFTMIGMYLILTAD